MVRAEKVILVAVNANETTGGDEAKIFANELLSAQFGRAKTPPSKNKAGRMARTIEEKLMNMVALEGDNIRVSDILARIKVNLGQAWWQEGR